MVGEHYLKFGLGTNMTEGEFGPIYEREDHNPDWKVQNDERYDMLERQLAIYTSESIGEYLSLTWS